jgi:hypothetical protein
MRSDPARRAGNAVVYLGLKTSSLLVENTEIRNANKGILLSETAHQVTIRGNRFVDLDVGMINSILGLYKDYPTGFSEFLVEENLVKAENAPFDSFLIFYGSPGGRTVVRRNRVAANPPHSVHLFIDDNFPSAGTPEDFLIEENAIFGGGGDYKARDAISRYGLWRNNRMDAGNLSSYVSGSSRYDSFDPDPRAVVEFAPASEFTALNHAKAAFRVATLRKGALAKYPVGFTTTIRNFGSDRATWVLPRDASWNAFPEDVPISPGDRVVIRKRSDGRFHLVK